MTKSPFKVYKIHVCAFFLELVRETAHGHPLLCYKVRSEQRIKQENKIIQSNHGTGNTKAFNIRPSINFDYSENNFDERERKNNLKF